MAVRNKTSIDTDVGFRRKVSNYYEPKLLRGKIFFEEQNSYDVEQDFTVIKAYSKVTESSSYSWSSCTWNFQLRFLNYWLLSSFYSERQYSSSEPGLSSHTARIQSKCHHHLWKVWPCEKLKIKLLNIPFIPHL